MGINSDRMLARARALARESAVEDHRLEVSGAPELMASGPTFRDGLVTGSVLLAAAAVECRISEIFQQLAYADRRIENWSYETDTKVTEFAKTLIRNFERVSNNVLRIELLAHLRDRPPMDMGREPVQPWTLLVKLRNALVHPGPSIRQVSYAEDGSEIHEEVGVQGVLNALKSTVDDLGWSRYGTPFGGHDALFPEVVFTPEVATWSVETSDGMIRHLNDWLLTPFNS